jgi:5-oxoprolinase (ATP-hydrolysing)
VLPLLQAVLDSGISSIAVVLKHAAIYPDHEVAVGQLAQQMGFKQVRSEARRTH